MRWLICLIVMGSAVEARSELVVRDPPMVRRCPRAKTWALMVNCLSKVGKPKVTKTLPKAKLVTMFQAQDGKDIDVGMLLYVEHNGEWQIGGHIQNYGNEYRLLGIEPVTAGTKSGYRLEVGQSSPFTLMVDNITPVPAHLRTRRSLFCGGNSYYCPEATTECEISVEGKAWYLFRGTFEYEDNVVNIKGDRSRGGAHCTAPAKLHLGWR